MAIDLARIHAVFDLSMRVGEGMLGNGAAASEVTATVLRIITSSGIRSVSVTVTFDEITISYLPAPEAAPFTRIRAAGQRIQNFARLEALESITERYVRGEVSLEEASARVHEIPAERRVYPSYLVTAGLALMGGSAAWGLGAGLLVTAAAIVTAAILSVVTEMLTQRRVPLFYVQAVGGFGASLAAVGVHMIDPHANSSIVVVACLIIFLAGLTSLGAMQDAITGWYVTASARILETLMLTTGLVVGVRAGLLVAEMIGADIAVNDSLPTTLSRVVTLAVSGLVVGLGYAVSVQVPRRSLIWCSALAAVTSVVVSLLADSGLDRPWAAGITALGAGTASVVLAERTRAPALMFVMAGVIPMVPGSRIYRGLLALGSDLDSGAAHLFEAAAIAVALAAGAVLGQLLAARAQRGMGRAVSAFTPVITAPFTTVRKRRQVAVAAPRAGRPSATPTGAMLALDRTQLSAAPSAPADTHAGRAEE